MLSYRICRVEISQFFRSRFSKENLISIQPSCLVQVNDIGSHIAERKIVWHGVDVW